MQPSYPFRVVGGRTATTSGDAHLRELIEQVLFTNPGERVDRPTFGCGLSRLLFAGVGGEIAQAVQALVQAALQQWLGDRIAVQGVQVAVDDATLAVTVSYVVRSSGFAVQSVFTRAV